MKNALRFLALSLALAFPAWAHAQLTLTLEKPNQAGLPGATLSYIGTLTNGGATPLFLTGSNFTLDNDNFTLDDSPFLDGLGDPASLDGGASYTGELFTVLIGANAASQIGLGTFIVIGGAEEGAQETLAVASFSAAAAPEPATLVLLTCGMTVGIVLRRRTVASRQ